MKRIVSVLLLAVCATIVCAKEPKKPTSYNYQRDIYEQFSDTTCAIEYASRAINVQLCGCYRR